MNRIKIAGKEVEIYDSIEDLPIIRFHKYNKYLLIDAGIGSDISEFDRHIEKVIRYTREQKLDLAGTELANLRQNVFFIQNELSPKFLAFSCLVKRIGKKEYDDLSQESLEGIVKELSSASVKELTDHLDSVKKKIDNEMKVYFPSLFDDTTVKEYTERLKQHTLLVLEAIVKGEVSTETAQKLDYLTNELVTYFKPHTFTGKDSVEIKYDRQFENMCLILSQNLNVNPKKFTVLEYYNAFDYVKNEAKKHRTQQGRK